MSVNVYFNGTTIFKPGSYSSVNIDYGRSFPLGLNGIVLIIGEAEGGVGILEDQDLSNKGFTAEQMDDIKKIYKSGPIVDACQMLFAPASDAAIPNGANGVIIAKTNSSSMASLSLGDFGTLFSKERGVGANRITLKSSQPTITLPSITTGEISSFGSNLDDVEVSFIINGDKKSYTLVADAHDDIDELLVELSTAFPELLVEKEGANKLKFTLIGANLYKLSTELSLESLNVPELALSPKLEFSNIGGQLIQIVQKRDAITENLNTKGESVLLIGCKIPKSKVVITEEEFKLIIDDVEVASFLLSEFGTLQELVEAINLVSPDWSASISSVSFSNIHPYMLDKIDRFCFSPTGKCLKIKKDYSEIVRFFSESKLVTLEKGTRAQGLLPEMPEIAFSGGKKGETTMEAIIQALESAKKVNLNFIVPLFSRDATQDKLEGITSPQSVYEISSIHALVKNHINEMKSVRNKMERQAVLSFVGSFESCKIKAFELADPRIQLVIQSVKQVDSRGIAKWFQPWMLACSIAGARSGSPIGTPLTFKYLNITDFKHQDFDPNVQCDEAIKAGITFVEKPMTGGIRIVVDNTTYSKDDNWFYNRASCIYASDIAMQNWRSRMDMFIGKKNNIQLADVQLVAEGLLREFRAQGITVGQTGYRDLSIKIQGNTIICKVTLILVEGIEFVLTESTMTRL